MANYCWNWVIIEGNEDTLKKIQSKIDKGIKEGEGYLTKVADLLLDENRHEHNVESLYDAYGTRWWDIDRNEIQGDDLILNGSSAWSPPNILMQKISDKYQVKVTIEFEEFGNDFGGSETYVNGVMTEEINMSYREWMYFQEPEYAVQNLIEDLEDCPDWFEDLDDLEKSLHYMTKEDKEEIKEVYLKQLNTIQNGN